LRDLWSDRLIAIPMTNPSKLQCGQEGPHDDLHGLDYDLGDFDTLTPQIKEDIKFQKGLIVKLSSGKFSWETESYCSISTLETNTLRPP
jgi:hypothetical protein